MASQYSPPEYFPTQYWQQLDDGRIQCDVCPRHCQLRQGKRGVCYIRMNHQQQIVLTSYGRSSGFCIDPIEKKPLKHFYPGSAVLSFGTAGCNLGCKFCQNWDISKSRQMDTLADSAMPDALAQLAQKYGCSGIAFTYNDPVIFLEYAVDVAQAAKALGLQSIAVSAGYICAEPRAELFTHMDAANIDLKAFREPFYRKVCSGHLADVLDTLLYLKHESHVWFELSTLLIPGENDSNQELQQMCTWIAEHLGADVPIHFTAFHPDFKMRNKTQTPIATLLRAREIALNHGLHYAYVGNVYDPSHESTYCPGCGNLLLERNCYQLGKYRLNSQGLCPDCGTTIAGVWTEHCGSFGRRRIPLRLGN
ncbi:AmmeMemoRadiSam system radical SAM enzyme [Agarivorans sp. Z349TD_8]|uniref:AmmeMemoRadiSam system radical SAM enzyme n=1 Tax=Agarivorans sp. Z349TD_8 TaxID=3421434 RepID=UPI003D7CBAB8